MTNEFNIQDLFQEKFGVQINEFEGKDTYQDIGDNADLNFGVTTNSEGTKSQVIGAKTTKEKASELYTDYKGRYYFLPIYLDKKLLPHAVLKFQSKKRIVETALVGQRGTVKEYITTEDYQISIRGFCLGGKLQWPEEEVAMLRDLYAKDEALEIASVVTDMFMQEGEDKVVIKSLDFEEFKSTHVVAYTMELVSDSIFTLHV